LCLGSRRGSFLLFPTPVPHSVLFRIKQGDSALPNVDFLLYPPEKRLCCCCWRKSAQLKSFLTRLATLLLLTLLDYSVWTLLGFGLGKAEKSRNHVPPISSLWRGGQDARVVQEGNSESQSSRFKNKSTIYSI